MSTIPKTEPDSNQIYFKQLLSGRDFAADDQLAQQMVNFVYLIGDKLTRECMIIDPAYAVEELLSVAEQDGMKVVGALATHYHPDHVGGSMMGANIDGIATLLSKVDIPIHVPVNDMQISEDLQLIVGHMMMQWLYQQHADIPRQLKS